MASTAIQIDLLEQDRFYQLAPNRPYYAKEKGSRSYIAQKQVAFKFPYIQHNPPSLCHWMTFDLDHENILIWEDAGLPEPNLTVRNLENRKCHISYAIESVCTSPAAKPRPLAYAASVEEAYREALKADQCYTGLLTKNPYSDEFSALYAHDYVFKLSELAKHVELKRQYWNRKKANNDEQYGLQRHMGIFHRLRYWGYPEVLVYRENSWSYNQWMDNTLDQCVSYNTFPVPLPYCDVKSTAKSVGNFCWFKYGPEGKPVRRGVMSSSFAQSQIPLTLDKKQRLAARRTNEIQRKNSEDKIITAIGELTAQGKRVTKAAVGRMIGMERSRVSQNYSHLFLD